MTKEQGFVSADHLDLDPFMGSQTRERALNTAIVQANISRSFEECLGIFDPFYADDIEVSSETAKEPKEEWSPGLPKKACNHIVLFNITHQ